MTPEQAIADIRTLSDEIEAGRVKSPASRLLDLFYKAVTTIVLSGPAGVCSPGEQAKPKRQRRPTLAEISKHGLEVRCEPDGAFVIARGKPTNGDNDTITPEDELERWRKKKKNAG
jgi:hypothetical protein